MRRLILVIMAAVTAATTASAQNKGTLVQRINEIKSQSDIYFLDQYTHPNADTAKINATKRLLLEVNIDKSEQDFVTVEEAMPHVSYINIDRGNLKQYFAYIKKNEAVLIKKGQTGMPVVTVQQRSENFSSQKSFVPDAFVQRIMQIKDFTNIYKFLESLRTQGQILQFGKLKDVEDYSSLDLILFDKQSQEVVTMLSSENVWGERTNMVDGTKDALSNYPTKLTAVIWYIKK